ncbi:alpha/beta hydrolase [Komarekiella sp. 'clone 1']|uniref:Alpha/beta hydrolase n=1 Tax=Komarekiella delphini-convector SJRDD-AB1 TaxID=2593771 RepID=A0AA40T4S6_9NOST|nr:alpha/beta hydrolase [Komarekiella delphini-convector]MBD6620675.1 alpha/beta hydrolase [Komarekiella delphini-convector SJRDD-AB1]
MTITENLILPGLGIAAIGLFAGIFYQAVSEAIDRRRYPPQGELVDIGGFCLHINCMGQGTPTVVMDAGGSAPSITWGLVPSEIAKFTRVCTYDRAGLGWSDPNPRISRTSQQSVDELHLLLTKARINPPYILVGHSLGGVNMRLYASQYPEDVVGLVLVDSSHENQMTSEMWRRIKMQSWLYQVLRVVSQVGVLRLIGEMNLLPILEDIKREIQKYPLAVQTLFDTYKSFCYRPDYWATASSELANIKKSFEELQSVTSLGSLPLIVLSQGSKDSKMSDERFQKWASLQLDLTKLSSNSQHIIAENSGHLVPLDQPELVISAVHQLIKKIKQTNL